MKIRDAALMCVRSVALFLIASGVFHCARPLALVFLGLSIPSRAPLAAMAAASLCSPLFTAICGVVLWACSAGIAKFLVRSDEQANTVISLSGQELTSLAIMVVGIIVVASSFRMLSAYSMSRLTAVATHPERTVPDGITGYLVSSMTRLVLGLWLAVSSNGICQFMWKSDSKLQ